jgi:hypothetical protein
LKMLEQGSPVQQARTAMAEFTALLMDIGQHVLPGVNQALRDFKGVLEGLRNLVPGAGGGTATVTIGARAAEGVAAGAVAGGLWGMFGGPVGVGTGAIIGGIAGGVGGVAEAYMDQRDAEFAKAKKEGGPAYEKYRENLLNQVPGYGMRPTEPPKVSLSPNISLQLNIDGQMIAHAITNSYGNNTGFVTQAPAADGAGIHTDGWSDR